MSASLLTVAASANAAPAAGLEIVVQCARLTRAERDELDARLRLLIGTTRGAPPRIELGCDEQKAWIDWSGENLPVRLGEPLTDEYLDVVEDHLERKRQADEKAERELAVDRDREALAPGAQPVNSAARESGRAAEEREARPSGGLALGIEFEPGSGSLEPSAGPHLEFGIPLTAPIFLGSPLLVSGVEAVRFSSSGDYKVLLLEFGAGIGVGAPLARGTRFGAQARFEAEWMIAYPEGTSAQAEFAPSGVLGLRAAQDVGWTVLWAEVAGRARFSALEFRGVEHVEAGRLALQFTLGIAFLDQSPR